MARRPVISQVGAMVVILSVHFARDIHDRFSRAVPEGFRAGWLCTDTEFHFAELSAGGATGRHTGTELRCRHWRR